MIGAIAEMQQEKSRNTMSQKLDSAQVALNKQGSWMN
jgi:hypothetical protein